MGHEPRLSTSGGGGGSKEGFFCFSLPVESGPSALLVQVETLVHHRADAGGESYCSLHCQAVLGANGASRLVASGGPLLGASKRAPQVESRMREIQLRTSMAACTCWLTRSLSCSTAWHTVSGAEWWGGVGWCRSPGGVQLQGAAWNLCLLQWILFVADVPC